MHVQQKELKNKGRFYIEDNANEIAKLNYTVESQTQLVINHTEVGQAYKGQGLGLKLINSLVEYARENGYKVLPLCSYAVAVFERKPEYADVLHQ